MKKILQQKLIVSVTLLVLHITFFSARNSEWPSGNTLSYDDKANCIQFKMLQGSNRINEFRKIYKMMFKTNSEEMTNNSTSTFDDNQLKKILGNQTQTLADGSLLYSLYPDDKDCNAIFTFNQNTQTLYCKVGKCR